MSIPRYRPELTVWEWRTLVLRAAEQLNHAGRRTEMIESIGRLAELLEAMREAASGMDE